SQFDAELLDIYLTEADEVLDTIASSTAELKARPDDREALTTVRRGFHTLKGSGRMVGLTDLGDLAFEVEKAHNRVLEEDRPATPALLALIDVAQTSFREWVNTLRRTGRVTPDAAHIRAALAEVEAALPYAPPASSVATEPSPAAVRATQSAPSVSMIEVIEQDDTAFPEIDRPDDDSMTVVDRPEVIEFTTAGTQSPPTAVEPVSEVPPSTEPDEITVGDVTLSTALFRILCDEAQQHLATLDAELKAIQSDWTATPSQAMVRAAHTLCGIHRTGGFPLVATVAKALEACLLALQERGAPLPGAAQPVLARAIAGLTAFTGRVRARNGFRPADEAEGAEIIAELDALRQESGPEPDDRDSETIAARVAEADEATLARPTPVPSTPPPVETAAAERSKLAASERPILTAVATPATAAPPSESPIAPSAVSPSSTAPRAAAPAAASAAGAPADDETLANIHDDVDRQVLPIFLEEASELFPETGEQLRAWRRRPADKDASHSLQRALHTLKGSARMAGAMRLGELAHLMENRLSAGDALAPASPELFDALDNDLDHIAFVLDRLQKGEVDTPLPWVAVEAGGPDDIAVTAGTSTTSPARRAAVSALPVAAPPHAAAAGEPPGAETEARAMLRVRADLIDRLVNEAGEVAITRARVEGELRSLKGNLLELTNSVIRLRSQVREIEIQAESQIQSRMSMVNEAAEGFDPLEFDRYTRFQELARGLAEGVNDVSTVQQSLLKNLDEADAALLAQARLSRDVQQQLFSIRTVPFGSLSERLYRILRQTAKELDKRANLEIRGTQVELDRSVLEKLVGPLEHLLRNALDHGIESREARRNSGKQETGEITLNVRQQGNEIAIELTDDGAGLDFGRIRDKARAQGLITGDVEPTEAQLVEFIFAPGFTTASTVTQISGRGVGMDVVRSDIAALGGRVDVASVPGKGTSFTAYLPLTLAVAQTVLVKAGGRLWALPAPMVEQVQQIKDKDLINLYLTREVSWQSRKYPFFYLPRLLGSAGHNPETTRYNSVLLLRSGHTLAAVHVDEMIGNQEVVVKNIGPQLARVSGISGATVLGTGEVVLIINPVQLAQRLDVAAEAPMVVQTAKASAAAAAAEAAAGPPLVMIVDDSLTVRKITGRLLTREGFAVVSAKDGLDALQLLAERTPDAILLDIEMPRMDGFEFARTVKADTNLAHIPIIMITSRTAEKHRNRAKELGVDAYLGKPYQEEELLRNLRELLALHTA
nr:Hpt domain-containing protein [Pseudomonadota bacterium]